MQDFYVRNCFSSGCNIYHVRNQCAAEAAKVEGGLDGLDYILWIDSDNMFSYEWFEELLGIMEARPEVSGVGAWYLSQMNIQGNGRVAACNIKDWKDEFLTVQQITAAGDELIEVDCLGFGFMLMRPQVLKDVGPSPFTPLIAPDGTPMSDDAGLMLKAKAFGHRFFVHPKMQAPHLKTIPLPLGMAL